MKIGILASLTFEYWMLHFPFSRKKAIFLRCIKSKLYFSSFHVQVFFSTLLSLCPWFLDYLQSITFIYIKDAIITM